MHQIDTKNKFVELRAQGWSLSHIAANLHVSKRTLVDWNRECAADIKSLRTLELELLQEKFLASREEELTRLVRLQKDVEDELANRTLKFVPTEKLFHLAAQLRQEIHQARRNNALDEQSPAPDAGYRNGTLAAEPRAK
jgi:hypothetical protein